MTDFAASICNEIHREGKAYKRRIPLADKVLLFCMLLFLAQLVAGMFGIAPPGAKGGIYYAAMGFCLLFCAVVLGYRMSKMPPDYAQKEARAKGVMRVLRENGVNSAQKFDLLYRELNSEVEARNKLRGNLSSLAAKLFQYIVWVPAGFFFGLYFSSIFDSTAGSTGIEALAEDIGPLLGLLGRVFIIFLLVLVLCYMLRDLGSQLWEKIDSSHKYRKVLSLLAETRYYECVPKTKAAPSRVHVVYRAGARGLAGCGRRAKIPLSRAIGKGKAK